MRPGGLGRFQCGFSRLRSCARQKVWDFWRPPQCCVHFPRKHTHKHKLGQLCSVSAEVRSPLRAFQSQMFLSVAAVSQTFHLAAVCLPVGCVRGAERLSAGRWHGDKARRNNPLKGAGLRMISGTTCFAHVRLGGNICFPRRYVAAARRHSELLW